MRIIAFFSGKGGVGKTSMANAVAAMAAARGMPVLVIDGDPRATATDELGLPKDPNRLSLNDLLKVDPSNPMSPADAIEQVIYQAGEGWPSNVHVIPAEEALENRDMDPHPFERRLAIGLEAVRERYKGGIGLIDLPPRAGGRLVTSLLMAADAVIVPSTLLVDGEIGAGEARKTISVMRKSGALHVDYLGIVRSIVPTPSKRLRINDTIEEILMERYPGEVIDIQISSYAIREHARFFNAPITTQKSAESPILLGQYDALLDYVLTAEDMMTNG